MIADGLAVGFVHADGISEEETRACVRNTEKC